MKGQRACGSEGALIDAQAGETNTDFVVSGDLPNFHRRLRKPHALGGKARSPDETSHALIESRGSASVIEEGQKKHSLPSWKANIFCNLSKFLYTFSHHSVKMY